MSSASTRARSCGPCTLRCCAARSPWRPRPPTAPARTCGRSSPASSAARTKCSGCGRHWRATGSSRWSAPAARARRGWPPRSPPGCGTPRADDDGRTGSGQTGSGWPSSRRSPMPPTCRRRCSARSACGNRACCRTARSGSPAATRGPGCLRASPTPAPCSSSTTASTSSTRAPTWRTRCSRTARGCGSWRRAGSRSASPGSRCSSSRRLTKIPPCACSPTGRRRSARISRWTARPARWSPTSSGGLTASRWRSSSPPPGCGRCRSPRSPGG